ncbi:hypothetical protein EI94DRAFT_1736534 [Lactarius quietus]|nr:hypothetical protein EI94DRAFT_1736534 [Lactarius quietus]
MIPATFPRGHAVSRAGTHIVATSNTPRRGVDVAMSPHRARLHVRRLAGLHIGRDIWKNCFHAS